VKEVVYGLFVALVAAAALPAQQVEPSEPEIVLPPILLKVQDVTQEKIDTPLPEEQAPSLPQIDVALPQVQNIKLGSAAYDVPVPTQGPNGTSVQTTSQSQASFFSDGLIGAGSMNHIIGDITLYKLGSDPRFNIEFSHERLDGYLAPSSTSTFQPAGAGFFNRKDALVGSLTYSAKNVFNFDTHDYYRETEDGLQGNANTYSSVTHRFISGAAKAEYAGASPFTFGVSIGATSGDMSLAGPSPTNALNAQELAVNPALNLGLNFSKVNGTLTGYYSATQTTGPVQSVGQTAGGTLSMSAELPLALTLKGSVGAEWEKTIRWAIPFSLELDGVYKDLLTYRLYGGYRVDRQSYFDLWTEYPFLDQSTNLVPSLEWYGGASASWHFGPALGLQSGVDFSDASAAVLPGSAQAGTGLFSFTQGRATVLGPSAELSWDPTGPFSLKLGWKGNFLNPGPFVPLSSFNVDAELSDTNGRYGGALSGTMNLDTISPFAAEMPNISLSGYLRVSSGVSFHLNMNDLLSPLSSGRKTWNYYYEPGFRVTVTTRISL